MLGGLHQRRVHCCHEVLTAARRPMASVFAVRGSPALLARVPLRPAETGAIMPRDGDGLSWAAMKSASLTRAGWAGRAEMTHPSGRFQRCTLVCPRLVLAGSASSESVRCRFQTWRPVYRGLPRMVVTVPRVQPDPVRCGFLSGSAADGHGTPASFSARAIRARLCPASCCANIHATTCAVPGSGSRRCARRPQAAWALFGCGPASPSRYPYGGRPPRYRPWSRVWAAIAVRTRMLVRVTSARRQPQHGHRLLVMLGGVVHPAACLGQPQLHAVVLEQRGHRGVLGAVERPLVLADHDRVPAPARVRERGGQGSGLRAERPRQHPALADVEELRHDGPCPRTRASACSRCRARDVTGSCQSSVDTRP